MTSKRPRILVGCDASPESVSALEWAVHYAEHAGGSIHILSAWDWPTFQGVPIIYGQWDPKKSCASTVKRLQETLDLPADRVTAEIAKGNPARILMDRATDADLVVVGSHGLGAASRLVLGSVSGYCATHGACPVAVVRAEAGESQRDVVVGVDDSENARTALRWAIDYADVANQQLTVLHVAEPPPPPIPADYPFPLTYPRTAVHNQIRRWLRELVAKEVADLGFEPRLGIKVRVLEGNPAAVLVDQSARTSLTVCGRRGSGGFRRLRIGSVASALAHHGHSTLVVTPPV